MNAYRAPACTMSGTMSASMKAGSSAVFFLNILKDYSVSKKSCAGGTVMRHASLRSGQNKGVSSETVSP